MPTPVITIAQMRAWEAATWASGQSVEEVIRRAGRAVAARLLHWTRPGDLILVLAGKGHNGDDTRQAAHHLLGRRVRVLDLPHPEASLLTEALALRPDWIVDGLFGIGLNRALSPEWICLIQQIEQSRIPVLSVDVPSGLDADRGEPLGAAIPASVTVTLGAPKTGMIQPQAARFVGRLEVAPDIGLAPNSPRSELQWTLPDDFQGFPPRRLVDAHKGSFGHVVILAGSLGFHGAAVLAARAAARARPGLVTVITQPEVYGPVAAQLQSAMVHPWQDGFELPESATALVVGPGLAASNLPAPFTTQILEWWNDSALPMVVDASALDWLPETGGVAPGLRIITPHPGEAARLLRTTPAQIQADRPAALRALARGWRNAYVVLKGHQTLVGQQTGPLFLNSSGNPGLAQGGSGDLLAGFLGGLLAQPVLQAQPALTVRFGVWQHGNAADELEVWGRSWTTEDLAAHLGT